MPPVPALVAYLLFVICRCLVISERITPPATETLSVLRELKEGILTIW